MKRIVLFALLAFLLLGSNTFGANPVELRFYYPVQVAGPLARAIEAMVNDFNAEHPDIVVEPIYSGNYDETMQRAQTAAMSNNPPEVAVLLAIDLLTLLTTDIVVPLDEYAAADPDYIADFFPGFLENSQYDGQLWSIPFQRSTPLLYFNKEMLAEAGLDPEQPPETWDELLEFAQQLTVRDANNNVERYGLNIVTDDTWILQAFILQAGGMYSNQEGTQVYFNSPEAIEALQFWVDLANEHEVMPRRRFYGDASADFVARQTAMMYNSTGSLAFVRDSADFEFGVAPLPGYRETQVPTGGGNFYIFKGLTPEKEQAAWTFVQWMTQPQQVADWSIASGYIPVRESALTVDTMQEYFERFPQAGVAGDQLPSARREMVLYNNQQIREIFLTAIQEALAGSVSVEEALNRAQQQSERVLRAFQ